MNDAEKDATHQEVCRSLRWRKEDLDRTAETSRHGEHAVMTLGDRDRYHADLRRLIDAGEAIPDYLWIKPTAIIRKSKLHKRPYDGVGWHILHWAVVQAIRDFCPEEPPA